MNEQNMSQDDFVELVSLPFGKELDKWIKNFNENYRMLFIQLDVLLFENKLNEIDVLKNRKDRPYKQLFHLTKQYEASREEIRIRQSQYLDLNHLYNFILQENSQLKRDREEKEKKYVKLENEIKRIEEFHKTRYTSVLRAGKENNIIIAHLTEQNENLLKQLFKVKKKKEDLYKSKDAVQAINNSHIELILDLNVRLSNENKINIDLMDRIKEKDNEILKLKEEHEENIKQLKEEHEETIKQLKEEHKEIVKQLKVTLEYAKETDDHKSLISSKKTEYKQLPKNLQRQ